MKRSTFPTPDAAVAVIAFVMRGMIQAFANEAPLDRGIFIIIKRSDFINSPTEREMIDDDVSIADAGYGIALTLFLVAHPNAEVSNDDIISRDDERKIFDTNSIAGSGLTGNGNIAMIDYQF